MRSVTGCLTCRRRKLKCDEQKPSCGQCRKARRDCQPSQIVFRHLQDSLQERYGSGKQSLFSAVHPSEGRQRGSGQAHQSRSPEPLGWLPDESERPDMSVDFESGRSLAVLVADPSRDLIDQGNIPTAGPLHDSGGFIATIDQGRKSPSNPRSTPSANNFLDSILNPPEAMEPGQTPKSFGDLHSRGPAETPLYGYLMSSPSLENPPETGARVAFLLRHFSEGPGKWMDHYDAGSYFSVDVPNQSLSSPLLKTAVCAYAAKQISRINMKPEIDLSMSQPTTSTCLEVDQLDWAVLGAQYYTKAINLLRNQLNEPDGLSVSSDTSSGEPTSPDGRTPRRSSDELLGVTAILCAYEHLSASDLAWSGHLSGTMALLNIATHELRPYALSPGSYDDSGPSKARKAIFWNFARQDFLAAFINRSQTRIDTEDFRIWRDAGLPLGSSGNLDFDDLAVNQCCTSKSSLRDYTMSKSMIWLLAKVNNFISARQTFFLWQRGRHSDIDPEQFDAAQLSQQTALKDRWTRLSGQLDVWFNGLTPNFKPCARIESSEYTFPEIWFSSEMCASTIQSYHLARILLLLHNPYAPTAEDSTVSRFLNFHRTTEAEITHRCHEICGIALSHKPCSMYLHQCQTLYVVGQCLGDPKDRRLVVDLLRRMRSETGWETEYRVQQLLTEWGREPGDGID